MPVAEINLLSWANTLEDVRLPLMQAEIDQLEAASGTQAADISAMSQTYTDRLDAFVVRIGVAESDASYARVRADTVYSAIYQVELDAKAYTDTKTQEVADQVSGLGTSLDIGLDARAETAVSARMAEIEAQRAAHQAAVDAAVLQFTDDMNVELADVRGRANEILDIHLPATDQAIQRIDLELTDTGEALTALVQGMSYQSVAEELDALYVSTDALIKDYAYSKAEADGATAAKVLELSASMSGGRVAVKGDFEDNDLGEWAGINLVVGNVNGAGNGATKGLRSRARDATEGELRPGDISGRSFRFTGYCYTFYSTVPARIGFNVIEGDGTARWFTVEVQQPGLAWTAFDVTLTLGEGPYRSWRPFILNSGTNGVDVMDSYWTGLELYDITDKTSIEATLTSEYLTSVDTNSLLTAAKTELRGEIGSANLVRHPNGNDGTVGDWVYATVDPDVPAHAPAGAQSLRVIDGAREKPLRPGNVDGRVFKVSAWVKNAASYNFVVRGSTTNDENGAEIISGSAVDAGVNAAWTYVEATLRPVADTTHWAPAFDFANGTDYALIYDLRWEDITESTSVSDTLTGEITDIKGLDLDKLAGTALATFSTSARVATRRGDNVLVSQYLDGWVNWSNGGPSAKTYVAPNEAAGEVEHTFWDFNVSGTEAQGMSISSSNAEWVGAWNSNAFTVEMDLQLRGGNYDGAGVMIDWFNSAGDYKRSLVKLTDMAGGGVMTVTGRMTLTATLNRPSDFTGTPASVRVWMLANYVQLGTLGSKHFEVHGIKIRPATMTEASVITQGTALSDLEGKASAAYVMRAKAGNESVELEAIAWEDANNPGASGSSLRMKADSILLDATVATRHLMANSVTTEKLTVGGGKNSLINSDFAMDLVAIGFSDWGGFDGTGSQRLRQDTSYTAVHYPVLELRSTKDNEPEGTGGVEAHFALPSTSGGLKWGYPVAGGNWYEFHAQIYALRCKVQLRVQWKDASGVNIGNTATVHGTTWPANGDTGNPDEWSRRGGLVQAPTGAAYAVWIIRMVETTSTSDGYCFIHKPFFSKCESGNSPFSEYSPGPQVVITGAGMLAKSVTAAEITVSSLSAITSSFGSLQADTANIKDLAVDTIKVKDRATSAYVSNYFSGEVQAGPSGSGNQVCQVDITPRNDNKLHVLFSCEYEAYASNIYNFFILVNDVVVYDATERPYVPGNGNGGGVVTISFIANVTVDQNAKVTVRAGGGSGGAVRHRFLSATELKK